MAAMMFFAVDAGGSSGMITVGARVRNVDVPASEPVAGVAGVAWPVLPPAAK